MKKCPYCGRNHSDAEVNCALDQHLLVSSEQLTRTTPFKKATLNGRDKCRYGIAALCFLTGIILLILNFKWGQGLAAGAIIYACGHAQKKGHMTNLRGRNDSD